MQLSNKNLTTVKIRRCKNCRKTFNFGKEDKSKIFCDQICKDDYSFVRPVEIRVCKYCPNIIKPRRNNEGHLSSWRITCGQDDCVGRPKKPHKYTYKKTYVPDLVGHTCKICNTYKNWSEFHKGNWRCKDCVNSKMKEYYQKNKEIMIAKSKKHYWANKE